MTAGDNVTALNDTLISINCPASGIPTPTITWTLDGEEIEVDDDGYVILENGTLVVEKGTLDDSGLYRCVATNVEGEDTEESTVNIIG